MKTLDKENVIGISALLVHAAKIDENYSDHEKKLVKELRKLWFKPQDQKQLSISPKIRC